MFWPQKLAALLILWKQTFFEKSWSHIGPQPNPQGRKWPQMDYLVMTFSSTSAVFIVFYKSSRHLLWKSTFSFKGLFWEFVRDFVFCVLPSETGCSSHFKRMNIFWKSWSHIRPQANPPGRKRPQMDYLVMTCSSKSTFFIVFYKSSWHLLWKNTFSFKGLFWEFVKDFVFCVLTSETGCSSHFMKANIFRKSRSHIWPQANPPGRKRPQMDYLVMTVSSK